MTGKRYYLTTLGDWQRYAHRFANSHWLPLNPAATISNGVIPNPAAFCADDGEGPTVGFPWRGATTDPSSSADETGGLARDDSVDKETALANIRILVLIEADEGVHLALEDDAAFEPLPHPLAQKPIPDAAQFALAPHGVAPGATTFDAAEVLAGVHRLLLHHREF